MRNLLQIAAVLTLAACDLNPLEGKPSQFQLHQERLAALEARAPVVERVIEYVAAPIVVPVVEPMPYVPPPEPACVPVFRVLECP